MIPSQNTLDTLPSGHVWVLAAHLGSAPPVLADGAPAVVAKVGALRMYAVPRETAHLASVSTAADPVETFRQAFALQRAHSAESIALLSKTPGALVATLEAVAACTP